MKKTPEELILTNRYQPEQVPMKLTPEQVAEEQSNVDFIIKQMRDYLVNVLKLDNSFYLRDIV